MKRASLLLLFFAPDPALEDRLARHRNLGKAFFENPTTHPQAVEEFRKALALAPNSSRERLNVGLALLANGQTPEGVLEIEKVQKLDPAIPHTWFNLGVQYKKSGDYDRSQRQFEGFLKLLPNEPVAHYNLAVLHKLAARTPEAIGEFEAAMRLDPTFAAPHFQLYNLYRQAGRAQDAAVQLKLFQEVKERQANSATPEDMEWSFYSEILEIIEPASANPPPVEPTFAVKRIVANTPGFLVLDRDAGGRPGILPYTELAPGIIHAAAGDFNNDGFPDVAAITPEGPVLFVNRKGRFIRQPLPATGKFNLVVWLDYDHDYDLDLLLLGETNVLLRNQGDTGFADRTQDFPFAKGIPSSAVAFRLIADTRAMDLAVTYKDRPAILYRDKLAGVYAPEPLAAPDPILAAIDADNNGTIDLLTESQTLYNDQGKFRPRPRAQGILADLDNRGIAELHTRLPSAQSYGVADFNLDGKPDLVLHRSDGALDLLTNQTVTPHGSVRIALAGVKNLKLAPGAEIEVKAGRLYQKKIYEGYPLLFGVRDARQLDAVRITWPNGLIQSEANQPVKSQIYKEAQRLSGSCPQVWTWNGRDFVYVTDVLGVAPLGAMSGDGSYFPVDHLDHVQLPGSIQPKDGFYEVRLTEELAEVAYIDQAKLIAVDHAPNEDVFINERFQSPPYPDLKIYTADRSAKSPPRNPLLVLTGWVNWADGSEFRKASQENGKELLMPSLKSGNRTILEDLGMPAGKPKTIAVELPEAAPDLRIVSNLDLHWTEMFLTEKREVKPSAALLPSQAELRFRGYSQILQRNPEVFAYANPQSSSMWNPTPGLYTRYGDVNELVQSPDDRFVIMGSGDELELRFDARRLPPLAPNRRRSFILAVDGWAKDRDPNTAHSQSVEPLPFHGMSRYPYPLTERFPDGAWRMKFNTRPALKLLRPLSD